MAETGQANEARPLAPARDQQSSYEEAQKSKSHRRIKLCGWVTATILLLLVIVIVILVFTVFKVKEPKITTNSVTLTNINLVVNPMSSINLNMSLLIDMSIKNPNSASFKYGNTTTTVYYHGVTVGEAQTPPGLAKARRTLRMNVTVDILADRLASSPDLVTDVAAQRMTLTTYTFISGRVKVLIIKKHAEVKMNCMVTVNITSREVQDIKCQRKVKL